MASYPGEFTGGTDFANAFAKSYNQGQRNKIGLLDILSREKINMLKLEQEKIEAKNRAPLEAARLEKTQAEAKKAQMEVGDLAPSPVIQNEMEARAALTQQRNTAIWEKQQANDAIKQAKSNVDVDELLKSFHEQGFVLKPQDAPRFKSLLSKAVYYYDKQPAPTEEKPFKSLGTVISDLSKSFGFEKWQPTGGFMGFGASKLPSYSPEIKQGVTNLLSADTSVPSTSASVETAIPEESTDDGGAAQEADQIAPAASGIPEGQTATHPTTKQKIIYKAGKWQAL